MSELGLGDSQNSNLYLSQPIDQPSQNSYVKVNRKFLNDLQQIHQIQQISHYRKQSSDNQQKSSAYNSNKKTYKQQEDSQYHDSQSQRQCQRQSQGLSQSGSEADNSKFCKKYVNLENAKNKKYQDNKQNTLEYHLLRKSIKTNHDQSHSKIQLFNSMIQKQRQLLNFKIDVNNPTRFHSPQRSIMNKQNMLSEFQKTNYRKMLEIQIKKNKELQYKINKLENQLANANLQINQLLKQNQKVSKQYIQIQKIKKQQKNKISQLDYKVQNLKNQYSTSYFNKNASLEQTKRQNKKLREENKKNQAFLNAISQSLHIVKGKKIDPFNLQSLWLQLKQIFQKYSEIKKVVKKQIANKKTTNLSQLLNIQSCKMLKTKKKNLNHS